MSVKGLKVYILAQDMKRYSAVQGSLENKGAVVGIFNSIEDIIEQMQDDSPDYALLSVNYGSFGSVRKLLGILQGSNISCIPCGEIDDKTTQKNLEELGMEQVIYPPLNPNKVENSLTYLEKLKKRKGQDDIEQVSYKAGKDGKAEAVNKLDYTQEQKEMLAEQLIELQIELLETNIAESESIDPDNGEGDLNPDHIALLDQAIDFESSLEIDEAESLVSPSGESENSPDMALVDIMQELGAQESTGGTQPEFLKELPSFKAVYFNSDQVTGYLFMAFDSEMNEAEKSDVFNQVEGQLIKKYELDMENHEVGSLDIEVEELDFCQWIEDNNCATHTYELKDGKSVCWAFVASNKAQFLISDTDDENFVSVSLETVNPDVPLKNDFYLHFPFNGKFLLYSREGRFIEKKQYNKLQDKKVENIHLRKEDISKYKDYKVEGDVASLLDSKKKAA